MCCVVRVGVVLGRQIDIVRHLGESSGRSLYAASYMYSLKAVWVCPKLPERAARLTD